jgi:hypothetical protein
MNNLSFHIGEKVRKLIKERGCEFFYLPPYSPDVNHTEPHRRGILQAQGAVRTIVAKSRGAFLVEARGAALDAIPATPTVSSGTAVSVPRSNPCDRGLNINR